MFDIDKIYTNNSRTRFLCNCVCNSEKAAKYIEASFLMLVRQFFRLADLYVKGNVLILDTPNYEKTVELAKLLNNSIKQMH